MKTVFKIICAAVGLLFITFLPSVAKGQGTIGLCANEDNSAIIYDPVVQQVNAQIQAHIDAYTAARINQNLTFTPVVIPVVFHILYNSTTTNIANSVISNQIAILNKDYSQTNTDFNSSSTYNPYNLAAVGTNNLGISFKLATRDPEGNATNGIIRKTTTIASFLPTMGEYANPNTGGSSAWTTDQYLNIWVVPDLGNYVGYCRIPGLNSLFYSSNGPVVRYDAVGNTSAIYYNKGRSLTHEIGHWLSLAHIAAGSCDPNVIGDGVADTPLQSFLTQPNTNGCPAFPLMNNCSATAPNGSMWMNHMDYTQDECRWMFTRGQADRMQSLFISGGVRESIRSSQGCSVPLTICAEPVVTTITNLSNSSATINWQPVLGATGYSIGYYHNLGDPTPAGTTYVTAGATATAVTITGLPEQHTVFFFVQTICGVNTSAISPSSSFTTLPTNMSCGNIPTGYRYINGTGVGGVKASQINFLTGSSPATSQSSGKITWFIGLRCEVVK